MSEIEIADLPQDAAEPDPSPPPRFRPPHDFLTAEQNCTSAPCATIREGRYSTAKHRVVTAISGLVSITSAFLTGPVLYAYQAGDVDMLPWILRWTARAGREPDPDKSHWVDTEPRPSPETIVLLILVFLGWTAIFHVCRCHDPWKNRIAFPFFVVGVCYSFLNSLGGGWGDFWTPIFTVVPPLVSVGLWLSLVLHVGLRAVYEGEAEQFPGVLSV